jgi:hypothetical protein
VRKRYFTHCLTLAASTMLALIPVSAISQTAGAGAAGAKFGGAGGYIGKKGEPDDPPPPKGPTPHLPDGKVDFSGVWLPGTFGFASTGQVTLQPWADTLLKQRRANLSKDDPESFCLPSGVPRLAPYPYKIVQTPGLLVILFEGNTHSYRQIFMDGRGHADDMEPTWMGDSIAKWEGNDTIVVDTVGFNDRTWLNGQGLPHSDQLHVIERYRRPDLGHLEIEITMEDPKAFTKPTTFKRTHMLTQTWEIHEYVCNENPIDTPHIVGK